MSTKLRILASKGNRPVCCSLEAMRKEAETWRACFHSSDRMKRNRSPGVHREKEELEPVVSAMGQGTRAIA